MCIIVYKPAGADLPARETLETCFYNNPDGAGFMIKTPKGIRIEKGFFSFDEFYQTVMKKKNIQKYDVAMHFRITTHGATCAKNCHPFIISKKLKTIRRLRGSYDGAIMHNGILNSVDVPRNSDVSDTAIYTRDVVAPLKTLSGGVITQDNNALAVLRATSQDNRLLLFDRAGVAMTGNWNYDGGCYYSNNSYQYDYSWYYNWNGSSYLNADSSDSTEEAQTDEDEGAMIKAVTLPYEACNFCPNAEECKQYGAYCLQEDEAWLIAEDELEVLMSND